MKRQFILLLALLSAVVMTPAHSQQAFPSKLVTIKIPYPAGGATDAGIRQIQPRLQAELGQTVIIENIPGAGGAIGVQNVLRLEPDGYTLLAHSGQDMILAPMVNQTAKYELGQFKLLTPLMNTDFVLASTPGRPQLKTLDGLLKFARADQKNVLSIGHWGNGSSPHLVGADLQLRAGIKLLEVPYKGLAAVIPDLVSGQIDLSFVPLGGPVVGLIRTGKIQAIAVTGNERNRYLPDVPTVAETPGLKDFQYNAWSGLFVRREVGEAASERLATAIRSVMKSPEIAKFAEEQAANIYDSMSMREAQAFYAKETEKLRRVAERIDLRP